MDITIIGTGNMARGIATRALAGGHDVTLLGTDRDKAQQLAAQLSGEAHAGTVGDPISSPVVVLAVPYAAIANLVDRYGSQFDGRVLIDICNPVDFSVFEPLQIEAGSAAVETAAKAPGAAVVKAFNTTFAATLVDGEVAGEALDVLIAADDADAKATVSQVVQDGGLRALDAGPLARSHELEALGYLHMALQQSLDTGFTTTIKILP